MTDCLFPKRLESPDMLVELSSPVAEATDGGLKSAALWVAAVHWVPLGSAKLVG